MNQRLIWVSLSCLVIGLASCGGNAVTPPAASGGNGGLEDSGDAEVISGGAGAATSNSEAAGAAGETAASAAGAAGAGGAAGAAGDSSDAGSGGVIARCSFTTLPVMPPPDDLSLPSETLIERNTLNVLDSLIGRFLRGDVVAYRGTASAHDNAGVIGEAAQDPTIADGTFPDGPVMATLDFHPVRSSDYSPPTADVSGDVAFLFLSSALAHKYVFFSQALTDPSVTEASQIWNAGQPGNRGLVSACISCAPDLWSRPKAIALDDMTTTGVFSVVPASGPAVDVTLHTVVSARLTYAPPCSLSYDELVVLNGSTLDFHQEGDELVEHVSNKVGRYIGGSCFDETPYTMDIFVDLNDLGHYGTRNFSLGPPAQMCIND
jgi:hypothetical protein